MDVRELILTVAKKCNKEDHVAAITKIIVEENWLDSIAALQNLNAEDWGQLQLPLKFVNLLRSELDALRGVTDFEYAADAKSAVSDVKMTETPEAPVVQCNRGFDVVTVGPPPNSLLWSSIDLRVALEVVCATAHAPLQTITMLSKIVKNCLNDPMNAKYRRLRTTNPSISSEILQITGGSDFLHGVGFENEGEWLVMYRLYVERLDYANALLTAQLIRADKTLTPKEAMASGRLKFDPFKSNQISKSGPKLADRNLDHAEYAPTIIKEQLEKELSLREAGGNDPWVPIPLNPVYCPPNQMRPVVVNQIVDTINGDFDDEKMDGPSLTTADLSRLKDVMTGNLKFRSNMIQQLNALRKIPIYNKARLILIAPDRATVGISLRPNTTVADLHRLVWNELLTADIRSQLGDQSRYWLSDPPLRPRLNGSDTLFRLGLVPTGQLRIVTSMEKPQQFQWLRAVF